MQTLRDLFSHGHYIHAVETLPKQDYKGAQLKPDYKRPQQKPDYKVPQPKLDCKKDYCRGYNVNFKMQLGSTKGFYKITGSKSACCHTHFDWLLDQRSVFT